LPDAMKHSGFPGLIPKGCDPYLKKAYLFAHTAYMVDFGNLINPDDWKSLKSMASSQLDFSKVAFEKSPYPDEFRVGVLKAVGLTDPGAFKKIVDVCNNLCKEVGKPELSFETAEKDHIKNNMICFFEDDTKDVDDGELTKMITDMLIGASVINVSFGLQFEDLTKRSVKSQPKINEAKLAHLWNLHGAKERLRFVKAELTEEGSFDNATMGCTGFFHMPPLFLDILLIQRYEEIINPALNGTLSVLYGSSGPPDNWLNIGPLKDYFMELFKLAEDTYAK
ncbi:hypothetical protein M8C21_009617, partial [Ambrosia artemisiifolia]